MRLILLSICIALTIGCASRQQKQDAADAVAGVDALEMVAPASAAPVATGARHYIAAAVKARVAELPPPTKTPKQVLGNPEQYAEDGKKAEDEANKSWLAVIIGGALPVLLMASRFGHLLGPAGAGIASALQTVIRFAIPSKVQEAEKRAKTMEDSAWKIVQQIEAYDTDNPVIKELKKKISEATPAEFNAFFDAWKKERQGGSH